MSRCQKEWSRWKSKRKKEEQEGKREIKEEIARTLRRRNKLRERGSCTQQELPPPREGRRQELQENPSKIDFETRSDMASRRVSLPLEGETERALLPTEQPAYRFQWPRPWRKRTRRSRRITQRRQRQRWKKEVNWESNLRKNELEKSTEKLQKYKNKLTECYGFCADPTLPLWKNIENYALQMTPQQYYSRATNMACHDYCIINPMPVGTRSLLGLGLKYCLKKPCPTNCLGKTIEDFKNNSRHIAYFHENPREPKEESTYNKDLYLKKSWEAPEASEEVEECLRNLERELRRCQVKYKRPTLSNLTSS